MIRLPTRADSFHTLPTGVLTALLDATGTDAFPATGLELLTDYFAADHWALFHHRDDCTVSCIASASRVRGAAARSNVEQFIERWHRVDPSLSVIRKEHPEPACIAELHAQDIHDRRYRHGFEIARVKERISLFVRMASSLYQLSIYRGWRSEPLAPTELASFAGLAGVIIRCGTKHAQLNRVHASAFPQVDVDSIEFLLRQTPSRLSRRESEVCARAAAGMTIERSADELKICRTSVITYRQRAYEKLGISRQGELLAILSKLQAELS